MIFNPTVATPVIECDLSIDEPLNEAFNFKTFEDAEKAFKKCKGDSDFKDWFCWFFKLSLVPVLLVYGIPVPVFHIALMAVNTWIAMPGSTGYKKNKCNWLIKKCDKSIAELEKKDANNNKKAIADYKKLKAEAEKELAEVNKKIDSIGTLKANSESVYCAGNNGGRYIYEAAYESYMQAKIDNENALADMLNSKLSLKIESSVVLEAKMGDKIKSKWNKLIEFIKGICAKFMETMSNVLLDQKEYLEKYKDIILKKKPKEDLKYSYTGDYAVGIDRLIKTELPIFNYGTHSAALKEESDGAAVKLIMKDGAFSYDEGATLAEQFKAYFTAAEKGQSEGNFTQLNMTDLYNFCYNFEQVKKIVDTDQKHLEQSTAAIDTAIKEEIRKAGENTVTDQTAGSTKEPESGKTGDNGSEGGDSKEESTVYREADDAKKDDKPQKLKITTTNSNAASQTSSYGNGENKKNLTDDQVKAGAAGGAAEADDKDANDAINDVTKMTDKWIRICRALITSKLTACEQISRDYMEIIRTHVRSYGGKDLKKKEDDKAQQQATNYRKPEKKEEEKPAENKGGEEGSNG